MTTKKPATKKPAAPFTHPPFFAWTHYDTQSLIDPSNDNSDSFDECKVVVEDEIDPSNKNASVTVDIWEVRHVGKFEITTALVRNWVQK